MAKEELSVADKEVVDGVMQFSDSSVHSIIDIEGIFLYF